MKRLLATIRKGSRTIQALLSLVLLLVLWWGTTAAGLINPLYLPSPQSVWSAFVEANSCRPQSPGSSRIICGEQQYFLWQHLVVSLERIGIGRPADRLVRHRRHHQDLAAIPRRVPAHRARHPGRHPRSEQRPGQFGALTGRKPFQGVPVRHLPQRATLHHERHPTGRRLRLDHRGGRRAQQRHPSPASSSSASRRCCWTG